MMKKYLMLFAALITLLVFGTGTGLAWNLTTTTTNNYVTVAQDDRGDLMYNQVFIAVDGGWVSDFWVYNTSLNRSVVAKVLIRSGKYSQDMRNFMIYLTPGDVFRGRLYYNAADGLVYITSNDDSVRNNTNTAFATAADPLNFALNVPRCDDTQQYGYVVVQQVAYSYFNVVGVANLTSMTTTPAAVRAIYMSESAGFLGRFIYGNTVLDYLGAAVTWNGNFLTGYSEIRNTTIGLTSGSTTMAILRDYKNTAYQFESANVVIGTTAMSNLLEVETALSTLRTDMPYVNNVTDGVSLITHAFPTKYAIRWMNLVDCVEDPALASPSSFFQENTRGAIRGTVRHMRYSLNMFENIKSSPFSPETPFGLEVNGIFTDAAHDPVLFSAEMDMGYMVTRFDQIQNFITQGCRAGYATDAAGAVCPNDVAGNVWFDTWVDLTGTGGPVFAAAPPVGYIAGTPANWDTARLAGGLSSAQYPTIAWPNWVNVAVFPVTIGENMTQYLYGVAFTGVPVLTAELRFGGQSFSLNACARTPGIKGTTTSTPGTAGGTIADTLGSNMQ